MKSQSFFCWHSRDAQPSPMPLWGIVLRASPPHPSPPSQAPSAQQVHCGAYICWGEEGNQQAGWRRAGACRR